MNSPLETVTFVVHTLKQFCFGFEQLEGSADRYENGSPAKAFYLNGLYHYIAALYLLDRGSNPMGGALYPALARVGLQDELGPIQTVLDERMGTITFGEVVRVFRNNAIVHTTYRNADLDRIYASVNMEDPAVQDRFRFLLTRLHEETRALAVRLAHATGRALSDFGIIEDPDDGPA